MITVSEKVQKRVQWTKSILSMLSEDSVAQFEEQLETCKTEQDVIQTLITPINLYFENGQYPNRRKLGKIVDKEQIIISERCYLPYEAIGPNGKGVISRKERIVLPLMVRANQQVAMKEGKSAKDDATRNIAGQVTGKEARSGALTDTEISVLLSHGADLILRELMGPASHDIEGAKAMKREIMKYGSVSLKNLPQNSTNKRGNLYLSHIMRAIGIDTDLIESPLK